MNDSQAGPRSLGAKLVRWIFGILVGLYWISLVMGCVSWFSAAFLSKGQIRLSPTWEASKDIAFLSALGIALFLGAVVPVWIVTPLEEAARHRRLPTQFRLVDLLCLFVPLQAVAGLVRLWLWQEEPVTCWTIVGYAWLAYGLFWAASVSRLSRAGIVGWRSRALFLLLAFPVALSSLVGLPLAVTVALGMLHEVVSVRELSEGRVFLTSLSVSIILLLSAYAVGYATRRMVARSMPEEKKSSDLETPSLSRPDLE